MISLALSILIRRSFSLQNQKVITIAGTIIIAALGAMYFTGAFDQSASKVSKDGGQPTVKVVVP